MSKRQTYRDSSNNPNNPNQNACALAVAKALGVSENVRYLHTIEDQLRAARTRFSVRSRKSALKGRTVGAIRKRCAEQGALGFIVWVEGHVMLLDAKGGTLVDTDPRKNDRRKLLGIWGIFPK